MYVNTMRCGAMRCRLVNACVLQANEADLRAHLGRYEIQGNDALKPMKFSSGGQKSRVAFACLTYAKPHVVMMGKWLGTRDKPFVVAGLFAVRCLAWV